MGPMDEALLKALDQIPAEGIPLAHVKDSKVVEQLIEARLVRLMSHPDGGRIEKTGTGRKLSPASTRGPTKAPTKAKAAEPQQRAKTSTR